MARLEDTINEIADVKLRERILNEVRKLKSDKKFGLVFEEHVPEVVPVYNSPIRVGSRIAKKIGPMGETYRVVKVGHEVVQCRDESDLTQQELTFPKDDMVVVKKFGETIYPTLVPVDNVRTNEGQASHVLIEADNYHALQLLEYTHTGKIDCIYIDPPYNTGARDWKYNNDYVDRNDSWRHSKWLAFMKRRLELAKQLLNPQDSVLILAIDDNELFNVGLLLDEIFAGTERQIIDITINPKGKARDGRLSQVDEYLIVVYVGEAAAQELANETAAQEIRWPYLRRSDVESARGTKKGGVRQFYPVYVDEVSEKIVHIGEPLSPEESLDNVPKIEGAVPVFPIREDGKEMNWGLTGPSLDSLQKEGYVRVSKSTNPYQPYNFSYVTLPSAKKVADGIYQVAGIRPDGTKIVVVPDGKPKRATTAWNRNLHDANAYGSQILGTIIGEKKFPFPKSLYAVCDALRTFLSNKPNALILDFFAGSGTTLHAVNLLNAEDNGQRRCIIVTNNEVSENEATQMRGDGYQPGDVAWEKHGICQSVTWPRTKHSILGRRDDGTLLEGEYFTNLTQEKKTNRSFFQVSFSSSEMLSTATKKKDLVALLGKDNLPKSLVKADSKYIVSDKYPASILFDDSSLDEWIAELEEQEHIRSFYIVTTDNAVFVQAKEKITELLGDIVFNEPVKSPMSKGFTANVEYFRLEFLDALSVELGREFERILPILWMMSGGLGPLPSYSDNAEFIFPDGSKFAVLLKENAFPKFRDELLKHSDLSHVFIITDSIEAFATMKSEMRIPNVFQLYRNYLENFRINARES